MDFTVLWYFQLRQIINGRHLFSITIERASCPERGQLGPGAQAEPEAAVWQDREQCWSRLRVLVRLC